MRQIQRVSVTDASVARIREMIVSGEYKEGEKLPTEAALCKELNVSRTSVREAMRVLQAWGYVDILPGRGAFVSNNAKKDHSGVWGKDATIPFYDIMNVRISLEILAIRLTIPKITPSQVRELEEIHSDFINANIACDWLRMGMLDELFHFKIAEYTQNQMLISFSQQVLEAYRKYRADLTNSPIYQNAIVPHSKILVCIQTKNVEQAVVELTAHLEAASRDMEKIHGPSLESSTPAHRES